MLILEYSWKISFYMTCDSPPERSALLKKRPTALYHPAEASRMVAAAPPLTSHHQQVKGEERSSAFPHCLYLSFHIWKRGNNNKKIVQIKCDARKLPWRKHVARLRWADALPQNVEPFIKMRVTVTTPVWVQDSP